ncbi:MAG: hypothetical protein NC489_36005 [Ruminococcus flavefaciens]|nr:hypothetical protein [Ruminococcus flavefaciens]
MRSSYWPHDYAYILKNTDIVCVERILYDDDVCVYTSSGIYYKRDYGCGWYTTAEEAYYTQQWFSSIRKG